MRNHHWTPPFPIRVDLPASADIGGRFHAALATGPLRYKPGFTRLRIAELGRSVYVGTEMGFRGMFGISPRSVRSRA